MTRAVRYPAVAYLADGARKYSFTRGLPPADPWVVQHAYARRDRGQAIADNYLTARSDNPDTWRAYRAFATEVADQYLWLTGVLGVRVDVTDDDPYATAEAMAADLRRGHLSVLSSAATGGHPMLTDTQNNAFRAVHDAFGHAAYGRGFDRHGEEAAWYAHLHMFGLRARRAMTTETRGQSSTFIWANGGREFPPQRAVLLRARYSDPSTVSTR